MSQEYGLRFTIDARDAESLNKVLEQQERIMDRINAKERRQTREKKTQMTFGKQMKKDLGAILGFATAKLGGGRLGGLFGGVKGVKGVSRTQLAGGVGGAAGGGIGGLLGGINKSGGAAKGMITGLASRFNLFAEAAKQAQKQLLAFVGGVIAFGLVSPRLQRELAVIGARMEQLGIVVGDAIAPAFRVLGDAALFLLNSWNSLNPTLQEGLKLGLLVAVSIAGLILAFGALAVALSPIGLAIGAVIGGVALLFVAWEENWGGIQQIVEVFVGDIIDNINGFLDTLRPLFEDIGSIIDSVISILGSLGGMGAQLIEDLTPFVKWLVDTFGSTFDTVIKAIGIPIEILFGWFENLIDFAADILAAFAGLLSGDLGLTEMIQDITSALVDLVTGTIKTVINAGIGLFNAFIKAWNDLIGGLADTEFPVVGKPFTALSGFTMGEIPTFARGGIVGGNFGSPQLVLAHAGEMIQTPAQQQQVFNNQRSTVINVYMNGGDSSLDALSIGSALGNELRRAVSSRGG